MKFKNKTTILLLFLTAFLIRLVYILQIQSSPLFGYFASDSYYYDQFALLTFSKSFFNIETLFFAPIYPLFLNAIYLFFTHNLLTALIIQGLVDSLTCILIFQISLKVFENKKIGILASLTYAFYTLAIFYSGFLLDTSLATFFCVLLIYKTISSLKSNDKWLQTGFIFGLTALLRANVLFFLFGFILWFLLFFKISFRDKFKPLITMLVGILIIFAPFSLKSYLLTKSLSPFPKQGGINFYIGNNPHSTGMFMPLEGMRNSAIDQVKTSIVLASKETGRTLTPPEASHYWMQKGKAFIKNNPQQFAINTLKKSILFLRAEEIPLNVNINFARKYIPLLSFPFLTFGILLPLAIGGACLCLFKRPKHSSIIIIFVLTYAISVILFFISARYRFPIVPMLCILSSVFIVQFSQLLKSKSFKVAFILLFIVIGSFIFSNYSNQNNLKNSNFYVSHNNLGDEHRRKKEFDQAIVEFKKALELNPHFADAHNNIGLVYYEQKEYKQAEVAFLNCLRIQPNHFDAMYNLALNYKATNKFELAEKYLSASLEISPQLDVYFNLAVIYKDTGRCDKALAYYKKSLALSENVVSRHIGLCYKAMGDDSNAKLWFDKINLD